MKLSTEDDEKDYINAKVQVVCHNEREREGEGMFVQYELQAP